MWSVYGTGCSKSLNGIRSHCESLWGKPWVYEGSWPGAECPRMHIRLRAFERMRPANTH